MLYEKCKCIHYNIPQPHRQEQRICPCATLSFVCRKVLFATNNRVDARHHLYRLVKQPVIGLLFVKKKYASFEEKVKRDQSKSSLGQVRKRVRDVTACQSDHYVHGFFSLEKAPSDNRFAWLGDKH